MLVTSTTLGVCWAKRLLPVVFEFADIFTSRSAFVAPERTQQARCGLEYLTEMQFEFVMMKFDCDGENALLVLQNGWT
jgi:hypothetical protein